MTLKVMPEDKEIDLERVKKEINSRMDTHSIEEEPIAFGLKALMVRIIIPDDAGGTDDIEEDILGIEGIKGVEVTDQRRLL